jgi:ABC-type multidrug transport system fused ATPase/permease subunit
LLRAFVREARRRRGRLANNLGEKLLASHTVRQLGRTEHELARVRTHSGWLRDALVRRARLAEALAALPDFAVPAALATWIAVRGASAPAELAAGALVLGVLAGALRDLARALEHRLAFEEGRARIAELLSAPRLVEKRRAKTLAGSGPVALELSHVSVRGALHDVSFNAKPGDRVLVTGAAGSGKSTLLALAARLLDPDAGELLLDGVPLRALSLDALHDAVQLVSPELPLLRGSVADNVSYGAEDDDADWISRVAEACGLANEPALAEGLATRVDERGANLSASLRARVALARAIAARPRLLLVDDAAFARDPAAGLALERALALHPATALVVGSAGEPGFTQVWEIAAGPGATAEA